VDHVAAQRAFQNLPNPDLEQAAQMEAMAALGCAGVTQGSHRD